MLMRKQGKNLMIKCDFCKLYMPSALLKKCRYDWTYPRYRESYCKDALRKYEKYLKGDKNR